MARFSMNWKAFTFSLAILLGVLIFVNLTASGIKMEGFQEGAGSTMNPKEQCGNKVKDMDDLIKNNGVKLSGRNLEPKSAVPDNCVAYVKYKLNNIAAQKK